MIKKLRRKFIVAAIIAVFLVLLVLIGSINVLNYRSLVSETDGTLQILAENKGFFPQQMFREPDRPADPAAPPDTALPPAEEAWGGFFGPQRGGSRELAYQSRYFAAWFADDGALSRLNLESLASLTEEEALTLAENVYASG